MNEKQRAFIAEHPGVHSQVLEFFPDYDYRHCVGDRNVICNMRAGEANKVGHQQRAFSVWWAIEKGSPMDLGLDLGSARGFTPYSIHVDLYGTGASHPFYGGGAYLSDVVYDASRIHEIVPASSLPFITSNHSLEHMPPAGDDAGITEVLVRWIGLLRPGGVLAMVVPDNDEFDVMGCDKDHKNAWGHSDFKRRVLDEALRRTGASLVDFDTLQNHFSFDVVVVRS